MKKVIVLVVLMTICAQAQAPVTQFDLIAGITKDSEAMINELLATISDVADVQNPETNAVIQKHMPRLKKLARHRDSLGEQLLKLRK